MQAELLIINIVLQAYSVPLYSFGGNPVAQTQPHQTNVYLLAPVQQLSTVQKVFNIINVIHIEIKTQKH